MRKTVTFLFSILVALTANAQTDVDMYKIFNVTDTPIDLVQATAKVTDGVVFVGDTRAADKIEEGKYRGMRVTKINRSFVIAGKVRGFSNALAFRRAPSGATKDHVIQLDALPRSCMIQLKPGSDGVFTFEIFSTKPEAKLYVGVYNGTSWKNIGDITYKNEEKKGTKSDPLTPVSLQYSYTEGDEIWIYSDGSANLLGMQFTGKIDPNYKGTDPMFASKDIQKTTH